MDSDEKRLKQEDCNEDDLGTGVLTLTNKRIAFDKRKSRIADFSTKMGETVIDVPLNELLDVWKEGRFIKKICIKIKTNDGEKSYKFGVFGTGGWLEDIQDAIEEMKNQYLPSTVSKRQDCLTNVSLILEPFLTVDSNIPVHPICDPQSPE